MWSFGIGALLGVIIVEIIFFGVGFTVERQFESMFIRVLACILKGIGFTIYFLLVSAVFTCILG